MCAVLGGACDGGAAPTDDSLSFGSTLEPLEPNGGATQTTDNTQQDSGESEDGQDDPAAGPVTAPGNGSSADGGGPSNCETTLAATVRDFSSAHPDFEFALGVDPGIVAEQLGDDGKPVYVGGDNGTTTTAANFDQWYRDVPDINMALPIELELTADDTGQYVFDSEAFFPIDDMGFGNESRSHNYHFTLELRTTFTYEGGEVFTFRGDDDLFTFINGRLGIDLGGVHLPLEQTIDLDAQAEQLGIEVGGTYSLDFFFAERHTHESNFRIETTIGCFYPVG